MKLYALFFILNPTLLAAAHKGFYEKHIFYYTHIRIMRAKHAKTGIDKRTLFAIAIEHLGLIPSLVQNKPVTNNTTITIHHKPG